MKKLTLICILGLWASGVLAESAAVVEALQLPAWLERDNQRRAIKPGMVLQQNDRLETGQKAKLRIRMSDGSFVKLGETTRFELQSLQPANADDNVFKAFLRVVTGAFRFTTFDKERQRDVRIKVGVATIGIRGTDLWGRSTDDEDFVVLIEGDIDIEREDDPIVNMNEAKTVYTAPRASVPLPVTGIEDETLGALAAETELDMGLGVLDADGQYVVYLYSSSTVADAKRLVKQLENEGFPAEIYEAVVNGKTWQRVGVPGFVSVADAKTFVNTAENVLNINGAWPSQL